MEETRVSNLSEIALKGLSVVKPSLLSPRRHHSKSKARIFSTHHCTERRFALHIRPC